VHKEASLTQIDSLNFFSNHGDQSVTKKVKIYIKYYS